MFNNVKVKKLKNILPILIMFLITIPSLTYSSSLFDDLKYGGPSKILDMRKIRNWNEANKDKIEFDNSRLGCGGYHQEYGLTKDCVFSSTISNNSDKIISYVVVKIVIMNKATEKVVVENKQTFKVSIIPTATKEIEIFFNNHNFKQVPEQLVNNWAWTFDFIGAIPQDMSLSGSDYNWL